MAEAFELGDEALGRFGGVAALEVVAAEVVVVQAHDAMRDRDLARDAFGVVCNCVGAWEDEYTEDHGEDALTFQDWMSRIDTAALPGSMTTASSRPAQDSLRRRTDGRPPEDLRA